MILSGNERINLMLRLTKLGINSLSNNGDKATVMVSEWYSKPLLHDTVNEFSRNFFCAKYGYL